MRAHAFTYVHVFLGMSAISANGSLSNSTFTTQRARVYEVRSCLFS
nr:MAG TPA: hypothetical protein [Microviridae sp.]